VASAVPHTVGMHDHLVIIKGVFLLLSGTNILAKHTKNRESMRSVYTEELNFFERNQDSLSYCMLFWNEPFTVLGTLRCDSQNV